MFIMGAKEVKMITEIGIVAGDIWHFLDQRGEVSFAELVNGIDKPRDNLLMSLGWLAREGHVIVQQIDSDYKISLRKNV
jgi:hypothetical protein